MKQGPLVFRVSGAISDEMISLFAPASDGNISIGDIPFRSVQLSPTFGQYLDFPASDPGNHFH
jgi:hypothetical protein